MQRGYRGVAGAPVRPYAQFVVNAGNACWLDLVFLDRFNNLATPTTVSYRIDNLTTDDVVLQDTTASSPASSMTLTIPASLNTINSDIGQTSQINQVLVTATFADGSQSKEVFIYELIALQTVGGA